MENNFQSISHTPRNYDCPICLGVRQVISDATLLRPTDIVYTDELVTAFISSFFIRGNEGHVIIVPNQHVETLYDMSQEVGTAIFAATQKVAIAMKRAYNADGITTRQNNEPAGDQHAFHYHQHIFPRYDGDNFNSTQQPDKKLATTPEQRIEYAQKLIDALCE